MYGFVNVLKPKGITSHDAVLQVRKIFGERRVGHLGTLDPMAVGVLPMALGCYTRLSEFLLDEDKEYLTEFVFGISTDTCDLDGRIISRAQCSRLSASDVTRLLGNYTGRIKQRPPMYSAVHVKGQRLHQLARRGIEVQVPEREVDVYEFRLLHWKPGPHPRGMFHLRVGRGTYVRSLARDLGDDLGCGAAVSYLLRTRVGSFALKDSVPLCSMKRRACGYPLEGFLTQPVQVFSNFPQFEIRTDALSRVANGGPIGPGDFTAPDEVRAWMERVCAGKWDKSTVFVGLYRHPRTKAHEIACVLSLVPVQGKCRIKYERVLVSRKSDSIEDRGNT